MAFSLFLAGCGGGGSSSPAKSDSNYSATGQIQFDLGGATVAKSLSASPAARATQFAQQLAASPIYVPIDQIKTITSVQFILKNASGVSTTYNATILKLGNQYLSTPVSVPVGTFQLTSYILFNGAVAVYGTPVTGSSSAGLVSSPLPINLNINKDTITATTPEVVDVALGIAADFGAASFGINVVAARTFKVSVFAFNSVSQALEYTNADLEVSSGSNTLFVGSLAAKTNQLAVLKQTTDYYITISKNGYASKTLTLTDEQLTNYDSSPLDIFFQPSDSIKYSLIPKSSGSYYEKTECVKDSVSGLVWEGKPANGSRAGSNTYSNYSSTTVLDRVIINLPTTEEITAQTNTEGYKTYVNNLNLCGYSDWRLPTIDELRTLADTSRVGMTIDLNWFPNTSTYLYWSSTIYPGLLNNSWARDYSRVFNDWSLGHSGNTYHIRLVRTL